MLDSEAGATSKRYFEYYERFKSFCVSKGFPYKPASSIHVVIYLTHLLDSKVSFHVISAVLYGIKWFHVTNDLLDPTLNSWVKSLLVKFCTYIKERYYKLGYIEALCDMYKHTEDVLHLRDLTMILLGYAGFLRFNEINELKCNDIEFKEDHVILKIRKSKTDVCRSGKGVFIAKGS